MEYFWANSMLHERGMGSGPCRWGAWVEFLGVPTQDLYYLKSICDDAAKRGNTNSFSKKFWWEVNPKNHVPGATDEAPRAFRQTRPAK